MEGDDYFKYFKLEIYTFILFLFIPFIFRIGTGRFLLEFIFYEKREKLYVDDSEEIKNSKDALIQLLTKVQVSKQSLIRKSNLFLIFGFLIAIIGIFLFTTIFQVEFEEQAVRTGNELYAYLSKTIILVFIEILAFYCFKQHRSTYQEYKYYLLLEIRGLSNLTLLLNSKPSDVDGLRNLESLELFAPLNMIQEGASTEQIELLKNQNKGSDINLVANLLEKLIGKL